MEAIVERIVEKCIQSELMHFCWFWLKLVLESNKTKLNRKEGLYHESKRKSFTQKLACSSPDISSKRS